MTGLSRVRRRLIGASIAVALVFGASVALAADAAPTPSPLAPVPPGNPIFAPVPGANITANGPATSIHGSPARGALLFAQNCTTCHNTRGVGNLPNPGSDDGTVPPLNPIDPGFVSAANGDPATFAKSIDLFVQHGSRPSGPGPQLSMIGWGDHQLLSQQDIADVESYVMQLNGVSWPDRWTPPADVLMDVTRSDGDVSYVTYKITLVNESNGTLSRFVLTDTLPAGLTYITSYMPGPGKNPAVADGTSINWVNTASIPDGGTLGPFYIVAQLQDPHAATVPPNSAAFAFSYTDWSGKTFNAATASNWTSPKVVQAAPTTAQGPAASIGIVQPNPGALSWGYNPATVTVKAGDTVTWNNAAGNLTHTVTADDGSFDSGGIDAGSSWSQTFATPGTYSYHCTPHPWMKATVVVQ